MLLAIVLSAIVLIGWQIFFGLPQMQQQKQQQQQTADRQPQPGAGAAARAPTAAARRPPAHPAGATAPAAPSTVAVPASRRPGRDPRGRARGLAARPHRDAAARRLDQSQGRPHRRPLLTQYRETVDPKSPPVVLLSPSGAPMPFYAEFGWVAAAGTTMPLPNSETVWKQQGAGTLGVGRPITLVHDNGQGLAVPPHHLGRRQVHVHGARRGREQGRRARHALSLCADLAPRPSAARRLLHPARRPDRRVRRAGPEGGRATPTSRSRSRSRSRPPTPGSASPTNIGRRRWCRTPTRPSRRCFSSGQVGTIKTYQTDYLLDPADHRSRARPAPPMRGCSPAPRRSRPSTATTGNTSSTASSS